MLCEKMDLSPIRVGVRGNVCGIRLPGHAQGAVPCGLPYIGGRCARTPLRGETSKPERVRVVHLRAPQVLLKDLIRHEIEVVEEPLVVGPKRIRLAH